MAIELFKHNQKAYEDASFMLNEEGKAAIIHPTGTGKSFIGFKFVEEHSDWKICWLSPSDYIFHTQLENIGHPQGYENLTFITYAKLINMSIEELSELHPDLIIMDEFHRAGAKEWGKAVHTLLDFYPETKVLGLSATNIRYLDNQRDMADELFENNIASSMTLGEAIVKGILKAPKYVISLYSYEQDLLNYEQKIHRTKNQKVKDEAQKYLDTLKRLLEQSIGLDEVFTKHITSKDSRFIVFCASYEHMQEMIRQAKVWFSGVDKDPHFYRAYSSDPTTNQAFIDFQNDHSHHLKLLFCIDMLNEGIHVNDIDGVILFRPTVSPIIYKQQIGRAMSASSKKNPIIFDIVNNFEAMNSIDSIQEEMEVAVNYYQMLGMNDEIETEDFEIYDEVKDCLDIFEKMNETLSASWDYMYSLAKLYYLEHGNLEVPKKYKTEEGYSLGTWLITQRRVYKHLVNGRLNQEQIQKLNDIGMRWDNVNDISWQCYYDALKQYHHQHGHIDINCQYVNEDGLMLGAWLSKMRSYYSDGIRRNVLTQERINALNELGIVWNVHSQRWQNNYEEAKSYYEKYGDLNMPDDYRGTNGVLIKPWLNNTKAKYIKTNGTSLTQDKKELLENIGVVFESQYDVKWNEAFDKAKKYYLEHGNLNVNHDYKCEDGFALGRWLSKHRESANGKTQIQVTQKRRELLDSIGMVWKLESKNNDEKYLDACQLYYKEYGNLEVYGDYKYEGLNIGQWLSRKRNEYKKGLLLPDFIERLNDIGMDWRTMYQYQWDQQYDLLKQFYLKNKHINVPKDNKTLNNWLNHQKKYYKENQLTQKQRKLLEEIGFHQIIKDDWNDYYQQALQYYQEYNNLDIPRNYITQNNQKLGSWIYKQKQLYQQAKLEKEKIQKLEDIGIVWQSMMQKKWDIGYEHAREYFNQYHHLDIHKDYISEDGYKLGSWISEQRKRYKKNLMSIDQIQLLESIQMIWNSNEYKWNSYYQKAMDYKEEYGNVNIPTTYKTKDGCTLGRWLKMQKEAYTKEILPKDRIEKLDLLGMEWGMK